MKALVLGASGYIGTNLVPRLAANGYAVRAASRDRRVLEGRDWHGIEIAEADALDSESLLSVLEGIEVAFYLVHSMAAGRDFGHLDSEAAAQFTRAAEQAGIERIVYLGGLSMPQADSEHMRSRVQTGMVLRSGSVPVTEIRAGIIVGPGSAAFEVIRDLVNNLPVMVTPRWVRSKSPPIALDNLIEYLVEIPKVAEAAGQVYDAGGPETLSYEDLMRQYGEIVGKSPMIIPVPVLSPRLSSYWLGLVTAVPTKIASALIQGLRHDLPADTAPIRRLVPQRLLTFREAVVSTLETERANAVAARWTEGALMYRNYRHDYAYYAKRASGQALIHASARAVWAQISSIGGPNRYYYLNLLWTMREFLDWLVGGPGLNRGRRHPTDLRIGDTIDSWQVIALEPERRLTLLFGMKAPGAGILEFEMAPEDEAIHITATAYWHPAGVWGLSYWYAFAPFHQILFRGLTRAIARRAEAAEEKRERVR